MQPGAIILGVNGKRVRTVDELRESVGNASGSAALLIERDGAQIFIPVRVG